MATKRRRIVLTLKDEIKTNEQFSKGTTAKKLEVSTTLQSLVFTIS